MPANARTHIVREGEIGTYHCWSRCVQRAFLCGYDPVTERDFDYRRGWIESLLAYLAGVFALDVGNYSVLPNHLHALLRTRPDLAAKPQRGRGHRPCHAGRPIRRSWPCHCRSTCGSHARWPAAS